MEHISSHQKQSIHDVGISFMNLTIPQVNGLQGILQIPGDKSISHRALLIGAIADGVSEIHSCSNAADPVSTLTCIKQLGTQIEERDNYFLIHGNGRRGLLEPLTPLDAGNSVRPCDCFQEFSPDRIFIRSFLEILHYASGR
jgi:hypothetical protein